MFTESAETMSVMIKLTGEIDELASDVVVFCMVPRSLVSLSASRLRLMTALLVLDFFAKDTSSAAAKLAKVFTDMLRRFQL